MQSHVVLLTSEELASIAALDTGASEFFDHRNPDMVTWLSGRVLDI